MHDHRLTTMVLKLMVNRTRPYCLRNIFYAATEGTVVTLENYRYWFLCKIEEIHLVEGRDYKFRVHDDIDSVYVTGIAGLYMLMRADNELGAFARRYVERFGVGINRFLTFENEE